MAATFIPVCASLFVNQRVSEHGLAMGNAKKESNSRFDEVVGDFFTEIRSTTRRNSLSSEQRRNQRLEQLHLLGRRVAAMRLPDCQEGQRLQVRLGLRRRAVLLVRRHHGNPEIRQAASQW